MIALNEGGSPQDRDPGCFLSVQACRALVGISLLVTAIGGVQAQTGANPAATPAPAAGVQPVLVNPADALLAMAANLEKNPATVAVTVGPIPITVADVADTLRSQRVSIANIGPEKLYQRVVEQLVNEKLAYLTAQKTGLDQDADVKRRQKNAVERVLADAWVARQAGAGVSDAALRARYEQTIAGRPGPIEVRARVILTLTRAEAELVIAKLEKGEPFDVLARQYSTDSTAVSGGDTGYLPIEALSPEIGAVVFALNPGQFTANPVHVQDGYFVLRVEGRRQRATPSFDDARGDLTRDLRRETAAAAIRALTADAKPVPAAAK